MVMSKDALIALTKGAFAPKEEMLEVARKKGKLFIGIPKEVAFQENRVPLVPDAVAQGFGIGGAAEDLLKQLQDVGAILFGDQLDIVDALLQGEFRIEAEQCLGTA